jgi:hypothetical protein
VDYAGSFSPSMPSSPHSFPIGPSMSIRKEQVSQQ